MHGHFFQRLSRTCPQDDQNVIGELGVRAEKFLSVLLGVGSSVLVEEGRRGPGEYVQHRYRQNGAEEESAKDGAVRHDGTAEHEAAPGWIRSKYNGLTNEKGSRMMRTRINRRSVCMRSLMV